jgi:hypothetical protein
MCMLPSQTINKFRSQLQAIKNIDRIKKREKSVDNMYSLVAKSMDISKSVLTYVRSL